jgi:Protein O-mannosyl-transferase TMEM260-like
MDSAPRRGQPDLLIAALLGGAAFALYTLTLAPTVLAGDGGEFQFVPYLLGVAHPTGYPLYSLLGWAWSHLLPVGDVAYRMNLFSAFWAALATGLLYVTAHALLRQTIPALAPAIHRLIAALAAVTFAVTPTFWSQAVIAEVYSLHVVFVVLLLYLLLAWSERRQSRLLLIAACCFGLSLAHHRTTLLLAPAILAYIWLTDRHAYRDWRLVLRALLLVLLPLVLYAYIPLRAAHTPYLHLPLTADRELALYKNTIAGFADFVLGGPFGGSVDLTVDLGERLAMAWGFLRNEVGWIGIVLALAGVARLSANRPPASARRGRWAPLALLGLIYAVTVAFNLFYTIGDIFVLFIPSYVVVVLWMAVGVGTLATMLHRQRLASILFVAFLFIPPIWTAFGHFAYVDQSHNTQARTQWETILAEPLPLGAVLVSNDRNDMMPMWYFQYVDGEHPDWLGLFPLITPDYPTLGHVLDLALSTGRPVYLVKEMPGVEVKVEVEREGELDHVLGPAVKGEPAHPLNLRLADRVALVGYDRLPHSPRPGEPMQVSLIWAALRPLEAEYHTFVHLLDPAGQAVAQSDRQPGGVYYPTTLWRPGERLRDDHRLTVPAGTPPGVYRLLAGMYALTDDGMLKPLGDPVVIGQVGVKTDGPTTPADISHPFTATFAGEIDLLGYDVGRQEEKLTVTLHWRCLQPPAADYTVFVHLLDASGEAVAQHDSQPQGGAYPTSICDTGEVVVDQHALSLPADFPAGNYRLRVGLYRPETGERLPVDGGGDSVELALDAGDERN